MVESIIAYSVGDTYTQSQIGSLLDAKSPVSTTGAVLITSATIGTAVSSVTVTNAFSADYNNYKIVISGGVASADSNLNLTLGASATGYYQGISICNYGGTTNITNRNNGTSWAGGHAFTTGITVNHELANPFLAANTTIYSYLANLNTGGGAGAGAGFHNVASSFTAFTIASSPGTLTGGTIKVYGYK
jgi:hypothetical protein